MNILYLCHRIPFPPNKGDKIRSFNQIRLLARNHNVHLACMIDDPEDRQYVAELEKYCASVDVAFRGSAAQKLHALGSLPGKRPLSVAIFHCSELQKKVDQRLESANIDAVFVFSSAMAEYVMHRNDLPRLMDFVDVDSEKFRAYASHQPFPMSWIYRIEANRLRRYEQHVSETFQASLLVSESEARLFRERTGTPGDVLPNGVDLEYYSPIRPGTRSDPPALVFTAVMDYLPNVDAMKFFCHEIFPHIQAEMPETKMFIVGRNPTKEVEALANDQVVVTGSVPDVRPYLEQAWVAVAPFKIARGVQNKVLEAMAVGLPVVGTSLAFQGIPAREQDGVRCADKPERFAQEVLELLKDRALLDREGQSARAYVENKHGWDEHGAQLERLLDEFSGRPEPVLTPVS